jgi:hypothetical protein
MFIEYFALLILERNKEGWSQYGEEKGPHQRKKYLTKGLASFQMAQKLHCQGVQVMEGLMDTLYSLACFCSDGVVPNCRKVGKEDKYSL